MEINGNYSYIPTVEEESPFASKAQDADQLRTDFLKMLTTQLEYQDPLEPVQNADFTAQMAQFTSLGEQQKSNELLQQLISAQSVNQLNDVVSYIGKQVVFDGNRTTAAGGEAKVRFNLAESGTAEIKLYDPNGQFVTSTTDYFDKGEQSFTFADDALQDGSYTFAVTLQTSNGNSVAAKTYASGMVQGVVNGEKGIQLEVDGRSVSLAGIYRVEQV